MGEFAFLYRGGGNFATPEERQKQMEKWMAWFREIGAEGHVKDPGHPLERAGKIVAGKPIARSVRRSQGRHRRLYAHHGERPR